MNVLLYVTEMQLLEKTVIKKDILSLWAMVNRANVIGTIYELNAKNVLGISGKSAIYDILKQHKIDAMIVDSVNDLSTNKEDMCDFLKKIRQMGVDVISLEGDLPNCEDCKEKYLCDGKEAHKREHHCTVKIF